MFPFEILIRTWTSSRIWIIDMCFTTGVRNCSMELFIKYIYIYLYIITYYLWRSDKHINSIIISDDDHHDHQNIYFPYIYTYIYIYRITNNLKSSYIHPKIFSWSVFSDDIISIYRKQFHYIIFYIQWIHDSWYIVYIYRDETIHN